VLQILTGFGSMYLAAGFVDSLPGLPAQDRYCGTFLPNSAMDIIPSGRSKSLRGSSNATANHVLRTRGTDVSKLLGKMRGARRTAHGTSKPVGAATASAAHGADAARTAYHGHHDGRMAYPAAVQVLAGTFYVTNGDKSTKSDEGILEYVYDYYTDQPELVHVDDDAHVATPFAVKLRFDGSADDKY
jgi:hypothetical protein